MKRRHRLMSAGLAMAAFAGCGGKGETIPVDIALKQNAGQMVSVPASGLRVAITPFEDDRADRTKLGTRYHAWGGESYFNVPGKHVGEATAQALAAYLNKKGWDAHVVKSGTADDASNADVTLSGRVLDLTVDGKGGIGFTDLSSKNKLAIKTKNRADGSSITDTVSHSGTYKVFWFEPQDGEDILADVLEKNFEKFLLETRVEGKSLRLR